ncbi:MAG: hypothetical protein ACREM3_27775 [Candidatus Rokuibacteriota bacterium]
MTDYSGEASEAVLRICAEIAAWFGVSGLPTVILDERLSLVGVVPAERFASIDWIRAGEPGGVILPATDPAGETGPPSSMLYSGTASPREGP